MSRRNKKGRPISGWLALDKPAGIGSTPCVANVKRLYRAAKAGHAGTLDPLACGMLLIALGDATKTVPFVMDGKKTYRFTVGWGTETTTDDLEGPAVRTSTARPALPEVAAALAAFRGEFDQVPPAFSAVKVEGERAYDLAREGEAVDLAPRRVQVYRLDILTHGPQATEFEIVCGKGTYVRSLARDLGRALGCYGHVASLRRTAVGPFGETDMVPLGAVAALEGDVPALDRLLLPTTAALGGLPEVVLTRPQASRILAGNGLLLRGPEATPEATQAFATLAGELVALGAIEQGMFHPRRVFPKAAAGAKAASGYPEESRFAAEAGEFD